MDGRSTGFAHIKKDKRNSNAVLYFAITGFQPDDKKEDSLQLETYIKDAEHNEVLTQITEIKALNEIDPGELEIQRNSSEKWKKF